MIIDLATRQTLSDTDAADFAEMNSEGGLPLADFWQGKLYRLAYELCTEAQGAPSIELVTTAETYLTEIGETLERLRAAVG